ncbi:heme binding [Elasticomyces elasticus]|nr:heme binding [Elasticomyces elasticus]KAK3647184.1 heme binding [Elasticomyces elasticus]KAK4918620.1 heme binding [Elasticomyces elasticus]KAK5756140.1 heme binding [Elasticomyces elasticus]
MDKIKKIFKSGDEKHPEHSSPASSSTAPSHASAAASAPSSSIGGEIPDGVVLHTTLGDITIALYKDQTPRTCKNFAELARTGKYDNVIFHRIIPGFMIQGGDPTGTGRGGASIYGAKFEDEFVSSLKHEDKGTLSMANSGPGTNGSQFFITLGPTPHLNGKHTVFGHVAQGMDVVDKLGSVRTGSGDRPVSEVKIERCDVV